MLSASEAGGKIAPRHRERRAYVYIRQSTPKQVQQHRESQVNQYALAQRAVDLGWPRERVHVIDSDLGQSGQDGQRPGFQELVSAVSLGHAGLILAYEASRLARNNADWYALLDLADVVGALIGDTDGVYDPRSYNDRLLLGLRGMLSEAELHLLQLRMAAGRQRQVERGVYRQRLPTGLLRLDDGRVVKDPDAQVQHAIALVFARFATLGSCQRVLRSLRADGILLPRRQASGLEAGQLVWKPPTESAVYETLRNPAYAGAFVYGRHAPRPDQRPGQRTRVVNRPLDEWAVIHRDAYPAYIDWDQFLSTQARLADNASSFARRSRAAPRSRAAVLAGLVVCGHCGCQMGVTYRPRPRYRCAGRNKRYAVPCCLHLTGAPIEAAVVDAFFAALAPAELALLDEVLAAQQADRARVLQQHADQVARAEYDARLAQRQYQAVDPDNRLVAAELERRWELALRAVAEAREVAECAAAAPPVPALDAALRAQLSDLGSALPALWASGRLTPVQKKELLRSLIRRVILTRATPTTIGVKIVWVSGAVSPLTVPATIRQNSAVDDYRRLVVRVLDLAATGLTDREIATRATAEGFRSARRCGIPLDLVRTIRREAGHVSPAMSYRGEDRIDGQWTVRGLVRLLGVSRERILRRLRDGVVPATRLPVSGHYLVADDPAVLARLRATLGLSPPHTGYVLP